jgi:hypothetical protein
MGMKLRLRKRREREEDVANAAFLICLEVLSIHIH